MFRVIAKMAIHNLLMRRNRMVLLVGMIGLSMGVMVALEGLYDGMSLHMIDKTKRSDCGEVSLYAKGYRMQRDIAYHIQGSDRIAKDITAISGVEEVLYRLKAEGLAQTARKSKPGSLIGIDLNEEEAFGKFPQFLQQGTLQLGNNGALIGSGLAKKLKIKLGSKVIFTTQDSHHEIQSVALRITGVVRTSNITLDDGALFISRIKLSKLLAMQEDTATQIALRVEQTKSTEVMRVLKTAYPSLDVESFKALYPQMDQMESMMDVFNAITFFIVMVVVFIGILGVMYVSILDRIREFGILLSVGYAYTYIRRQILLESLLLGVIGYLLGVMIGVGLLYYLARYGVNLSMFAEGMESFGMDPVIYATMKVHYFTSSGYAIMVASLLSVWLPLRKIKKLNPVDVIRSVG